MRKVMCAGCSNYHLVDDTTFYRNKRWCYSPDCKNVIDEKVKNMNFVRRMRKMEKGKFRGGVAQDLRDIILRRDMNTCSMCYLKSSTPGVMQVHHITPVSKGGTDEYGNLITLCKPCHSKVHNKGWEKYVERFQKSIEEMEEMEKQGLGRVIPFPVPLG